jgi:hypothetical protein
VLIVCLSVAVACGDDAEDAPQLGNGGVTTSCENIDRLESYRYTIRVRLQTPAFEATPAAEPDATPPPLGAFAETLTALLSDFKIQGAHVAPDRTQAILQFRTDEVELRAVGDRRWERFGTVWQEQTQNGPDIGFLTPTLVCEEIVQEIASGLDRSQAEERSLNEIEADFYELDRADLHRLPELLGADPDTELPQNFQVGLWLAKDGQWPVRLTITAEDADEQGNPIGVSLYMDVRDVGDPGISIEPPVVVSED